MKELSLIESDIIKERYFKLKNRIRGYYPQKEGKEEEKKEDEGEEEYEEDNTVIDGKWVIELHDNIKRQIYFTLFNLKTLKFSIPRRITSRKF